MTTTAKEKERRLKRQHFTMQTGSHRFAHSNHHEMELIRFSVTFRLEMIINRIEYHSIYT